MLQEEQAAFPCMLLWGNAFFVLLARRIELYDGAVSSELLSLAGLFRKCEGE